MVPLPLQSETERLVLNAGVEGGGLPMGGPESPGIPDLDWVAGLARLELRVILILLASLVGLRLLDGRINLHGLLCVKRPGGSVGALSPARVQLLIFTLVAAVTLTMNLDAMRAENRLFLSSEVTALVLGGSHATYLASKFLARRSPT